MILKLLLNSKEQRSGIPPYSSEGTMINEGLNVALEVVMAKICANTHLRHRYENTTQLSKLLTLLTVVGWKIWGLG